MLFQYCVLFQMANATSNLTTTIAAAKNASGIISSPPAINNTTIATTGMPISNATELHPLIFLQTKAAQGIAGTFAFAAILITCHQVSVLLHLVSYHRKGYSAKTENGHF